MIAATACLVAQPVFGALSIASAQARLAGGMVFTGCFIVPFFLLIGTGSRDFSLLWRSSAASSSGKRPRRRSSRACSPSSTRLRSATAACPSPTVCHGDLERSDAVLAAALWAWSGSWWPARRLHRRRVRGVGAVPFGRCARPQVTNSAPSRPGRESPTASSCGRRWHDVPGRARDRHAIVEMVDSSFDVLRFFPLATEADIGPRTLDGPPPFRSGKPAHPALDAFLARGDRGQADPDRRLRRQRQGSGRPARLVQPVDRIPGTASPRPGHPG